MIEKYVTAQFEVSPVFDGPGKVASFQPDIYVPAGIEQTIDGLAPDPRFAYAHIIAMSDGEKYGSNLNGDVFSTQELTGTQSPEEAAKNPGANAGVQLPRFKTFEDAKFFRHHANGPTDPAYGDVLCSDWNDPMKRVELIVRIAKEDVPELGMKGAPDVVLKLDQRGFITVSMGCRIQHEECSYCGRTNQFVRDRCPHLANMMNQIMPDGQQVRANNYGMRFFDISDVTIPADPIAYSLQKVASAQPRKQANLARDVGEQYGEWYHKLSEMEKTIPSEATIGDRDAGDCPCPTVTDVPAISRDDLERAYKAASGDIDAVIGTTALMGIVLSPVELATLTQLHEPAKVASGEGFRGFAEVALDKFSSNVYDALRSAISERSGYVAPCLAAGWEPRKIADAGFEAAADYYTYYRLSLGSLPRSTFVKAAHRVSQIRELLGNEPESRVQGALFHLAHAGLAVH